MSRQHGDYAIKIPPLCYLHVQDRNDNTTRLEVGPKTFTCMDHETVIIGPEPMLVIPPRHYCIIADPVLRDGHETIQFDKHGQVKLRHGDREVRFEQEPFPLYPGEKLIGKMEPLTVVPDNKALRLRALRDLKDKGVPAGAEWLFEGPATYVPRVDVQVVESISASVIGPGEALKLRARRECKDKQYGIERKMGEEWIMREEGAYMPSADEEPVDLLQAIILSQTTALHMCAKCDFTDLFEQPRQAGDHWLITYDQCHSYIPHPLEEVVEIQKLITLNDRTFAVIENPYNAESGKFELGTRKIVRGPKSFFLQPPHEKLVNTSRVHVLGIDDALHLKAVQAFDDESGTSARHHGTIRRQPGEEWLFYGPGEYWPPLEANVERRIKAFCRIDALNLCLFQPKLAALSVGAAVLAVTMAPIAFYAL